MALKIIQDNEAMTWEIENASTHLDEEVVPIKTSNVTGKRKKSVIIGESKDWQNAAGSHRVERCAIPLHNQSVLDLSGEVLP